MGQKRTIPSTKNGAGLHLINAGVMTGTAVILSQTFDLQNLDNIGLQIQWTGNPTGTIEVMCSIDNVTFYALTFDPALAQPAGTASGYLVNLNQLPFPYLAVRYTNSAGAGTLNVWLSGKDLN